MFYQIKQKYEEIVRISNIILAPIILAYYIIHRVTEEIFIRIIWLFCPIDEHIVILRSYPDYSDNGRALADYMIENGYDKDYRIYYDVADPLLLKEDKRGLRFISCEKSFGLYRFRWLKIVCSAKYHMFTHRPILIKKRARKGQILVNLFHGNGYKDRSERQGNLPAPYDFSIVSGPLFIKPMSYFWNIDKERVLPIGFPRYNWLLKEDKQAEEMLNSYKVNSDSKVVIWMPTFRADKWGRYKESDSISQFPLVNSESEWFNLDKICRDRNIVLLIKLHPFQKDYCVPFSSFTNIEEITNEEFDRADVPMYKFLALTDALVSDYSSVAIDYLLVDRPIAFALEDYNEYKNTRGFVFEDPRVYMPGHHLYSYEDLTRFLKEISLGKDVFREERRRMRTSAIFQSEDYCRTILEIFKITKPVF